MVAICIVALFACVGLIDAVWLAWKGEWLMLAMLALAVLTPVLKWLYSLVAFLLKLFLHYPVRRIAPAPASSLQVFSIFLSHVLATLLIGSGLFALCAWSIPQSRALSLLTALILTVNTAVPPSRKEEQNALADTLHTVSFVAALSTSGVFILGILFLHADEIVCGLMALPVVIAGAVFNIKLYRKRLRATGGTTPWAKQ